MLLNTSRRIALFLLVSATVLAATASAQGPDRDHPKLDAALAARVRNGDSNWQRVIIRTMPDEMSAVTAALLARGYGVASKHPIISALTAEVPVGQLEALSRLPAVISMSLDAVVTGTQTATDTYTLRGTLGLRSQTQSGNRVGVAIIDSGLEGGPEFDNRITGFYDFTRGGQTAPPTDAYGHGTHIAGLIAGNGDLSQKRYRGVAPKAKLVVLKVLDANGAGRTSDVISAIEFVTSQRARLGVDVINLSLGHPIYEPAGQDPLVQAVEAAVRAGIVVVAAAGNHGVSTKTGQAGYAGVVSPANAPSAITVGVVKTFDTTTRLDDRIPDYSSRGPSWYDGYAKPDLVAPGHALVSTAATSSALFLDNPALRVGNSYLRLSGTSMATGVVTGTVALILEANRLAFPTTPPLTPNAIKAILQFTAFRMRDDQGAAYDYLTQGAGVINPVGAIELASKIDTSRPVSSWWLAGGVDTATVLEGEMWSWAENIVCGYNVGG
ncbi:MAG: S8 family peptidase [Acidobacteria bacterium]|nr:S8 family peptidase [Acidobacteriota bacterium]